MRRLGSEERTGMNKIAYVILMGDKEGENLRETKA
jgi:hypothetical protein